MLLSASLRPHVPYLRRFARALTGSQATGDTLAVAALEAIAGDEQGVTADSDVRVALYHAFLKVWRSAATVTTGGDGDPVMAAADRSLEALTPTSRVVFLLRELEEFSAEDCALILDRPAADIPDLLEQAGREISSQLSTDVLIIEDEAMIAMELSALVTDLGHTVMRVARTHREVTTIIAERTPGLVLADIQLDDGSSGLDAVNEMLESIAVPVVFITAYPEKLLTGNRPEPTFLIPKPFRPDTVKAIISQALFFDHKARALPRAALTN